MLKDCITGKFSRTKQIEELFGAEQPELNLFQEEIMKWMDELHILTCTENIGRWEKEYGLDNNTALTIEQRRARVFAKKSERSLPKKAEIEQIMQAMLNAKRVAIYEEGCRFEISVETALLAENIEIAKQYFRQVRPAHFGFDFVNDIRREHKLGMYLGIAEIKEKEFTWEVEF